MEFYFLRAKPPHCPAEYESIIYEHWKTFVGDPNRLEAVLVAKPEEEKRLDSHVINPEHPLFDTAFYHVEKFKPDHLMRIFAVVCRY